MRNSSRHKNEGMHRSSGEGGGVHATPDLSYDRDGAGESSAKIIHGNKEKRLNIPTSQPASPAVLFSSTIPFL